MRVTVSATASQKPVSGGRVSVDGPPHDPSLPHSSSMHPSSPPTALICLCHALYRTLCRLRNSGLETQKPLKALLVGTKYVGLANGLRLGRMGRGLRSTPFGLDDNVTT